MKTVEQLRRAILAEYAKSVGLTADVHYISGAPMLPVVPLDTGSDVFIIGAYPSARFGTRQGIRDVPMADNLGPFEPERYYDGERVRVQPSAAELEENYLKPLGVPRERCWVTDLVKVFLFKEGHARKYQELGGKVPKGYVREDFEKLGAKSVPWIEQELALAKPRLVITLGTEVAGIFRGVTSAKGRIALLGPKVRRMPVGDMEVQTAHLPHPGIVMRVDKKDGNNPWPERNKQWVAELAAWLNTKP
jgi:uracil-DNA glycosylase